LSKPGCCEKTWEWEIGTQLEENGKQPVPAFWLWEGVPLSTGDALSVEERRKMMKGRVKPNHVYREGTVSLVTSSEKVRNYAKTLKTVKYKEWVWRV